MDFFHYIVDFQRFSTKIQLTICFYEVISMSWSYERFKHLLIDKKVSRTQLMKMTGISKNVFTKIAKNEPLNMATIGKICNTLHCRIEDILEWIYEEHNIQSEARDTEPNQQNT